MFEVVFNHSAKASMRMAKNYDEKRMLKQAHKEAVSYGYIGKKPSRTELKKHFKRQVIGQAIGGSPEDVVYIGFSLDIGDISEGVDSKQRREVFNNIWYYKDFDEKEREDFFHMQSNDFKKLVSAAEQGVPIRIWKSNKPFSACGFAFVCHILRKIDCKIKVVSLPEYNETPNNTIVCHSHWGQIPPGQFYNFLSYEKELSNMEKSMQASLWQDLKIENSPLRAIVNGKLISVPEDFYDHIIIDNIPDEEFVMAHLIGNIIGKYSLGVGDRWYALRIEKMIEENRLKVVEDKSTSHPYEKILKKITI